MDVQIYLHKTFPTPPPPYEEQGTNLPVQRWERHPTLAHQGRSQDWCCALSLWKYRLYSSICPCGALEDTIYLTRNLPWHLNMPLTMQEIRVYNLNWNSIIIFPLRACATENSKKVKFTLMQFLFRVFPYQVSLLMCTGEKNHLLYWNVKVNEPTFYSF